MSGTNSILRALVVVSLALLVLPNRGWGEGQKMSRILLDEPAERYLEPIREKPPYSGVLDDSHHVLTGLGPNQDREFDLENKYSKDVQTLLGLATEVRFGENDDTLLCYVSSRPGDNTAALFTVYPEWLIRVQVHADKTRVIRHKSRCRAVDGVGSSIRTKGGLKLGMTRPEVEALFGPPHRETGRMMEYSSERSAGPVVPGTQGESGRTVWRFLSIWFDVKGRVNGFSILANSFD